MRVPRVPSLVVCPSRIRGVVLVWAFAQMSLMLHAQSPWERAASNLEAPPAPGAPRTRRDCWVD
jgi:hypothetical protein